MSSTFVKDRDAALLSLDENKIRAFCRKYNVQISDNPLVFWASIYKSILAMRNCPADIRENAGTWRDSHGFHREIGPVDAEPEAPERIPRHSFEHVIFPTELYKWGQIMMNQVIDGGQYYLAESYRFVDDQETALAQYKPKHFKVLVRDYPADNGKTVVARLELPKPTRITECRRIYLCRNDATGKCLYFTSELSVQGTYYLCAWTKNHSHLLISIDPVPNEFDRVAELFPELADFEPPVEEAV